MVANYKMSIWWGQGNCPLRLGGGGGSMGVRQGGGGEGWEYVAD